MSCGGDGLCMQVCTHNRGCTNQHVTSTFTFCKKKCIYDCELIPCKNNTHCKSAFPAYFYKGKNSFITNGSCNMCTIFNVTFLKEKRECFICSNVKYMVTTKCQHEMCFDCLSINCFFCGMDLK